MISKMTLNEIPTLTTNQSKLNDDSQVILILPLKDADPGSSAKGNGAGRIQT